VEVVILCLHACRQAWGIWVGGFLKLSRKSTSCSAFHGFQREMCRGWGGGGLRVVRFASCCVSCVCLALLFDHGRASRTPLNVRTVPFPRPRKPRVDKATVIPTDTPGRFHIDCQLVWESHQGQKLKKLTVEFCNTAPAGSPHRFDDMKVCKAPGTCTGTTVLFEATAEQLGRFRFRLCGQNIKGIGYGDFTDEDIALPAPPADDAKPNTPPPAQSATPDETAPTSRTSLASKPNTHSNPQSQSQAEPQAPSQASAPSLSSVSAASATPGSSLPPQAVPSAAGV
jgi:hypothetical protein